jgi:serine O-acetyltransferase
VSRWAPSTGDPTQSPSFLTGLRFAWTQLGLRATILYRVSHALHRSGIRVLPGIVGRLNAMLHGIDIPPSVPIGPGLYIPHPFGTVVMARRIGAGTTLVSCVTIGMRNEPTFPVIGDNVYVSAGARVLGGITIGNNVAIGANAVVLRDVPDDHVAVGVPATARPRRSERLAEVAQ